MFAVSTVDGESKRFLPGSLWVVDDNCGLGLAQEPWGSAETFLKPGDLVFLVSSPSENYKETFVLSGKGSGFCWRSIMDNSCTRLM